MKILNDKINRVGISEYRLLKVVFPSDMYPSSVFSGGGEIWIEQSDSYDFSNPSTSHMIYTVSDLDGSNEYVVSNGNILDADCFGKLITFKIKAPGGLSPKEAARFTRVHYKENGIERISDTVLFTSLSSTKFSSAILTTDFIPKKVKLELDISSDEVYDITVFVTNNALDGVPVFEDMTAKFLANEYFDISNTTKESGTPWAVQVKVSIKKPENSIKKVEVENMNILIL